jgi:non-homologous end joining protein Ku
LGLQGENASDHLVDFLIDGNQSFGMKFTERYGHAALAQWTLQNREHLVLLRPGRCGPLLHTLFYADEVRALDEFRTEVE